MRYREIHLERRTRGMKMRCRNAVKQIGSYIDGELNAQEAKALREHIDSCDKCSRHYAVMRGLVSELSSLPAIVLTPEESFRLVSRLRQEMAQPIVPAPVFRRVHVPAAALSLLVLATVAGVSLVVWNGRSPTPGTQETPLEAVDYKEASGGVTNAGEGFVRGETGGTALITGALARPELVISDNEYDTADLADFRNDLGTRLDFYSTYWYPASSGSIDRSSIEDAQAQLTGDLALQAAEAGHDAEELERAVTSVLEQADGDPLLPCYAELAKIDGREAWLISASGPEDYLLFPDRELPPAMMLASLGGEGSLEVSESVLKELAALLAPSGNADVPLVPAGKPESQPDVTLEGTVADETETVSGESGGSWEGEHPEVEPEPVEEDFQSFLRRLAAQGTRLDIISALNGLNYEQILLLLQGDWKALAADGVNLSDFLAPPQRLWAVDCASGEVLWSAE